jgi:hypothetical protein
MSKKETADKLWSIAVKSKTGHMCARCLSLGMLSPAHDAHHIVHKTQGLALKYSLANGIGLCRTCHELDKTGKLKPWCIDYIGGDKHDELLSLRHGNIKQELVEMGLTMDEYLDKVIARLEDIT